MACKARTRAARGAWMWSANTWALALVFPESLPLSRSHIFPLYNGHMLHQFSSSLILPCFALLLAKSHCSKCSLVQQSHCLKQEYGAQSDVLAKHSHLPCGPWERWVDFLRFFGTQLEDSNARWLVALVALTASQLWFYDLWLRWVTPPLPWMKKAMGHKTCSTEMGKFQESWVELVTLPVSYPNHFSTLWRRARPCIMHSQEGRLGHSAVRTHHVWVLPELPEQQFERLIECSFSCSLCSFVFSLLVLFVLSTILHWLPLPRKKDHMAEKQTEH